MPSNKISLRHFFLSIGFLFILCLGQNIRAQSILYVDASASTGGDGRNWGVAFKYLQDALTEASAVASSSNPIQIWVAEGTYKPDEGGNVTLEDRSASFHMVDHVSIYGGFKGVENSITKRNWISNPTILSGEIGNQIGNTDNSYHVLSIISINTSIDISGFEITAGNANEQSGANSFGGGLFLKASSPNISYCNIHENEGRNGAGLYLDISAPIISNCVMDGNKATQNGSAMYNSRSEPVIINCSLKSNYAILNTGSSIYNSSNTGPNNIIISNCILWNSGTEIETVNSNDVPMVSYSIVKGGYTGVGNIDEDPLFVAGYNLLNCSPAINKGDNAQVIGSLDFYKKSRIGFSTVDMGAMEYSDAVRVIYVDSSTVFDNNGSSWLSPHKYLYSALENIPPCNNENIQVWIAQGTYFPDISNPGSDPRDFYFTMIDNVAIYGGFEGGETSLTQRDFVNNKSILSGDLNEDGDNTTNTYHVVKNEFTSEDTLAATAILDGLYVTDGNANGGSGSNDFGGGIYNKYASPTIRNCTFEDNVALDGGAIHNERANPLITESIFKNNVAARNGGAIALILDSNAEITHCDFIDNFVFDPNPAAPGSGGGAIHFGSIDFPRIENCLFENNISEEKGGAINGTGFGFIGSCIFNNNEAENGGAIHLASGDNNISNCTFTSNISNQKVSINDEYGGGAIYIVSGIDSISDCTFISNTSQVRGGAVFIFSGETTIDNSEFENNTALPISGASGDFIDLFGGALYLDSGATGDITNSKFYGNDAQDKGGAVYTESDESDIINCLFYKNTASQGVGCAIALVSAEPEIVNCTLVNNFGNNEMNGCIHALLSSPTIHNAIFWNDGLEEIRLGEGSQIDVLNSIVQGGYLNGVSIIDLEPQFVDVNIDDYTLKSCSPAIDMGLNMANPTTLDLASNPRFYDATTSGSDLIDMGAYEFQNNFTAECPCLDELVLTGLIDGGTYEASISITCDGIIETGSDVIFNAPVINLSEEFEIEDMGTLETQTEGCENN